MLIELIELTVDEFIVTTCNIEGAQFVIQLIRLLLTKQRRQLKK